jgi:hypothetical protein
MADLSSLSTEQLEAYKSLLYRKQSTQMEQSGGPGVAKPPLPEGLQDKEETLKDEWTHPGSSKFWVPTEFRNEIPQGIEAIANQKSESNPKGREHGYSVGTSLLSQGLKKAAAPVAAGAMAADPLTMVPAAVGGMAASTGLQKGAEYVAGKLGASPEQADAAGEVASWLPLGGMATPKGRAISSGAVKGAVKEGFSPVHVGRLKIPVPQAAATAIGGKYLGAMGGHPGEMSGAAIGAAYPFVKGAVQGAREAMNTPKLGPVENPAAPKMKTPTLGQMQEAVKSGHMTMDQFNEKLPSLGYDPDAQALITKNLQAKLALKSPVIPGETPKGLNLGHLKDAVKNDLMSMDEFDQALNKQGYNKDDREMLKSLLEKQMEKEAAKGKIKKPD